MSELRSRRISIRINEKLAGHSETPNNPFIFRIHRIQRRENEDAYEPEILSIGPYHIGKNNLQKMEKYKLEYLNGILKRRNEESGERYIKALVEVEEEARSCYAEHVSLSPDEFVEMMLLDGCFIIEFLRKHKMVAQNGNGGYIFSMDWLVRGLYRDLLLFENQLPFFILDKLFDMTKIQGEQEDLIHLAISCLNHCIGADNPNASSYWIGFPENVFHLLGLMYQSWCPSSVSNAIYPIHQIPLISDAIYPTHQIRRRSDSAANTFSGKQEEDEDLKFIKSVSELEEFGIIFRKALPSESWLDIKFDEGVMRIPTLVIHDDTESLLRNLIIYEEYIFGQSYVCKIVTDYAVVMNCLINSSEDVKKLRDQKIIENWTGDDEVLSNMFNKISNHMAFCPAQFSYRKLCHDVNKHCGNRFNIWISVLKEWIAILKIIYFSNPWSIISFVAATVLLLLTLIQTILSLLEYVKGK